MVYGAGAVLPCDIIHDSPRVRMYEEKEAKLDGQDDLDELEEKHDVSKVHSHSINNRPGVTRAEKYLLKHTMWENLFYASQRRKRISSNPNGRAPS